jgi:hypothetical protein
LIINLRTFVDFLIEANRAASHHLTFQRELSAESFQYRAKQPSGAFWQIPLDVTD